MTREQFVERLGALAPTDQVRLTALANEVMNDAREPVRAAVELWSGVNPVQEQKAAAILSAVDELAFVPLTERADPLDPQHRVWLLRMAGMSQLDLRAKLIAMINRMLDDRRRPPAKPVQGPPMEENPPMPRVCDEAYLLHRQLLNFSESREQFELNARAFLQLPDAQKDAEILHLRKSHTWQVLTSQP